jgi:hypothetical protein
MLVVYLCVDFDYMIMVIVFAKYSPYYNNPLTGRDLSFRIFYGRFLKL